MTDGTKIPVHQIPLQRMGKAQEIAELVNFLIEARYITGQVISSANSYTFQTLENEQDLILTNGHVAFRILTKQS